MLHSEAIAGNTAKSTTAQEKHHHMSHEIETHGDQAAFFSAREDAWHRLGTVTTEAQTAEDALRIAHLDWDVRKVPQYIMDTDTDGNVIPVVVPGKFATVRTNPFTETTDILGTVGKVYTPVQNRDNCEFLNQLVGLSGAHFETAGSLYNGRKVFVTMKAPEGLMIGGHDAVDLYLVAHNSHDGSSPFTVTATPIRVVCRNTLDAATNAAKASFSIRHSGDVADKVAAAQKALGVMWDYSKEFAAIANDLHAQKMSDAAFRRLLTDAVFPVAADAKQADIDLIEKRKSEVFDLWKYAPTNEDIRRTKWAAYNAVAEWTDWFMPVRGNDITARATRIADDPLLRRIKGRTLDALV